MIAKERLSILLKLFAVIMGVSALTTEILSADNPVVLFYFFTVLMNVICMITFILLIVSGNKGFSAFRGCMSVGILIVMLVFHFVIRPTSEYYSNSIGFFNFTFHYAIPCIVILDFILFSEHGKLKWYHPLWWLGLPISYIIFVFIRASIGQPFLTGYGVSSYPYYFFDINSQGLPYVVLSIIAILCFFLLLGYAIFGLDKLCLYTSKRVNKKVTVSSEPSA